MPSGSTSIISDVDYCSQVLNYALYMQFIVEDVEEDSDSDAEGTEDEEYNADSTNESNIKDFDSVCSLKKVISSHINAFAYCLNLKFLITSIVFFICTLCCINHKYLQSKLMQLGCI